MTTPKIIKSVEIEIKDSLIVVKVFFRIILKVVVGLILYKSEFVCIYDVCILYTYLTRSNSQLNKMLLQLSELHDRTSCSHLCPNGFGYYKNTF